MRGPSSSHSAAACRIGLLLHDLMKGDISDVVIDYDPNGSLVTTHQSQGTDMGLYGGLLGWEADDIRMMDYQQHIEASGIHIKVNYLSYGAKHPNNYRVSISNPTVTHTLSAISIGGGMMEVQEIDGSSVSMHGDYHELLIYGDNLDIIDSLLPDVDFDFKIHTESFLEIKSSKPYTDDLINQIESIIGVTNVCYLRPVIPVLSRKNLQVPFLSCQEMMEIGQQQGLELWELALLYETSRGNVTDDEVIEKMRSIVSIMQNGIKEGIEGHLL